MMMGYQTPNIDRIAREGTMFTDYYGQQSCTAGRAAFIMGQSPFRTGLTKVGLPGADLGLRAEGATIAELLKPLGYVTGQFGKNHLGDKDEFLPTAHGFDEFFGNLYHLNAEEEPENADYPKNPEFRQRFGPRGMIKSTADGNIQETGRFCQLVDRPPEPMTYSPRCRPRNPSNRRHIQDYANRLRRRRPRPGDKWHLDEVCLTINGRRHDLWRAVDQDNNVLDILVQSRRNKKAAKKFFRKLLKGLRYVPRIVIIDKLKSYGAAKREVLPEVEHR